ncbi:glutamate receptor ionotropic, kainate 2-like isoform X7 [Temnothorax nylanderi]|uniref:glutamate receptor ionotropic, kainate 2-like isoform X7 n=1 Tax=Temnothorax nylanderi TaxID=102681 RepID=UPI003A8545D4
MNDREMLLLYVTVAFMPHILGLPRRISIGGLFDSDEMIEKAFEISIKAVNKKMSTPERARNVSLTPITKQINKNAFQVANIAFLRDHIMHFWELHHAACELIDNGVIGIFGPQDKSTASYVQSMCDTLDIPHIAARWDSELKRGNAINLHPHPDSLSMVFQNLIEEYKWKEYAIIYDNTDGLIRINRLLKLQNLNTTFAMVFHLGSGPNFRQAMEEVKMSGYRNLIIDCSYNILASVLEQAQQVGIMSERYRVIITSLDLQTLDLEPYQYSGVNLTGVRLIDPESSIVRRTLRSRNFNWNLPDGSHLRVEAALAYDAVQLFASGYARLRKGIKGNLKNLSCSSTEVWEHGFSLSNYMRNERIHGLTGLIRFDTAGFRTEFQLDIVNLGNEGLYKVGRWETNFGIQWKPGYRIPGVDDDKSLRDKHFLVLISLTDPYGMLKQSSHVVTGNDRYEGFAIDLIQEMSKMLGFNYTFEVQADNDYGSLNNITKKWSGMLGKIIDGKADLAITDLTITATREEAVDFTSPFMNLGKTWHKRSLQNANKGSSRLTILSGTVFERRLGVPDRSVPHRDNIVIRDWKTLSRRMEESVPVHQGAGGVGNTLHSDGDSVSGERSHLEVSYRIRTRRDFNESFGCCMVVLRSDHFEHVYRQFGSRVIHEIRRVVLSSGGGTGLPTENQVRRKNKRLNVLLLSVSSERSISFCRIPRMNRM